MAQRVNPTEVKEIINTDLTDAVVQSSIDIASRLVDDILNVSGIGLADDRLADVELYLSAHLVAMRDQHEGAVVEEEAGDARVKFVGKFGEGLKSTRYGQMAIFLDTSKTLEGLASPKAKALFTTVAPVDD